MKVVELTDEEFAARCRLSVSMANFKMASTRRHASTPCRSTQVHQVLNKSIADDI